MTDRENRIRAWRFQRPQWIPVSSGLPWLDWASFGYDLDELETICIRHPVLFPGFARGSLQRNHQHVFEHYPDLIAGREHTDGWGCVWQTTVTGMVGAVKKHPLSDWSDLADLHPPQISQHDGMRPVDWNQLMQDIHEAKRHDQFTMLGLPHGHTFLRVQDIRGYMNLILDMADQEPHLETLIERVTAFNEQLISRYIQMNPDAIGIAEDLGMQQSPLLSADHFRQYIAPCYERLTRPVKEAGILVHEHSDGYILPLVDDLVQTGGDVLNMQDLVNGINDIARFVKGRVAIDLDIDRQHVTVSGSVKDIDDHIRECVTKLASPEGGLSLCYQPWPPTSSERLDAVFTAMEKYCVHEYIS